MLVFDTTVSLPFMPSKEDSQPSTPSLPRPEFTDLYMFLRDAFQNGGLVRLMETNSVTAVRG